MLRGDGLGPFSPLCWLWTACHCVWRDELGLGESLGGGRVVLMRWVGLAHLSCRGTWGGLRVPLQRLALGECGWSKWLMGVLRRSWERVLSVFSRFGALLPEYGERPWYGGGVDPLGLLSVWRRFGSCKCMKDSLQ